MKRQILAKELLNILVCPVCKGDLILESDGKEKESLHFLYCSQCDQKYPVQDGIPNMLPPELRIPSGEHKNNVSLSIKQANMGYGYRFYRDWDRSKWLANPASVCGVPPLVDFTLKYFNQHEMKILDPCSGIGVMTSHLANCGLKLFCSDISHESIAALLKHNRNLKNTFVADAENMPVKGNFFDGVIFSAALHHLPNPRKGLSESFRVLKDGGRVILLEPNSRSSGIIAEVIFVMLKLMLRPSLGIRDLTLIYKKALAKALKKKVIRHAGKEDTKHSDGRWLVSGETDHEISLPYTLRLAKTTGFKVLDARTQDLALAFAKLLRRNIGVETWSKMQRIDQILLQRIPLLNRYGDHFLVALQK